LRSLRNFFFATVSSLWGGSLSSIPVTLISGRLQYCSSTSRLSRSFAFFLLLKSWSPVGVG
jgi:hypothetical protein